LVVAVDERRVGRQLGEQRPERRQHARRLRGVRAAADAELAVGAGEPSSAKNTRESESS